MSSTYRDLVDERREVIQALLESDCLPAGMEMFPAANEDQWTLIREVIDECDYYIVIVGGRYGSISTDGVSYTEQEYDYAVESGIPVLGFVHADPDAIPKGKSELDPEASKQLDAFRSKVMQRLVRTFSSPADLGSAVSRSLTRAIRRNPRPGWVRGTEAMTPEMRAEVAELRASLASAQSEKVQSRASMNAIDSRFASGQTEVSLNLTYSGQKWTGVKWEREEWEGDANYSWDDIIRVLGPAMLDEASETQLRNLWDAHMAKDLPLNGEDWPELSNSRCRIENESWARVIIQLRALGIIASGDKKRAVADHNTYWKLTGTGDLYLVSLVAAPSLTGDE